jgi:transposase-like protein
MNMEQIQQALQRDFYLDLSDGFLYNCLDWKICQLDGAAYRQWSLEHFSGTLCIDELHLGRYTLLLATDPLADFPVAFALVTHNDQDHMERFLQNLRRHGFQPRVIVTDGSNLYPKLLAAIWPSADHQLCIFHVLKDINQCILDAVRRLQRRLRRRGNQGRRRGKGRPKDSARRQQRQTQKAKASFVYKHRYLIVKRRDELTAAEARSLGTLFEYLPELRPLRGFVDEVYSLFAPGQTAEQVQRRYRALQSNNAAVAASDPDLAKALAMLEPEKFAKMIAYLRSPVGQRVRTNNHVERTNRRWRLLEKVRYKWRRQRSIVRFVILMIHRQWPTCGQPTHSHPANKVEVAAAAGTNRWLSSLVLTPEQVDHAQAA